MGDYATVGQPRVAVIDANSFWIYGYFEETQINGIHVGDPARIKLMGYRQTLTGQVESITRGITDQDSQIDRYGLPDVNPVWTWFGWPDGFPFESPSKACRGGSCAPVA